MSGPAGAAYAEVGSFVWVVRRVCDGYRNERVHRRTAEMTRDLVVRAQVDSDRIILVEARPSSDPEEDVGVRDLLAFEGVEDSIRTISQRVTEALKSVGPDRASVEFGIDVTIEGGALTGLLARGSGTATLKITLFWDGADG